MNCKQCGTELTAHNATSFRHVHDIGNCAQVLMAQRDEARAALQAMRDEDSRRLHREYSRLVEAQRNGAKNAAEVVKLTDECAAKGIILGTELVRTCDEDRASQGACPSGH